MISFGAKPKPMTDAKPQTRPITLNPRVNPQMPKHRIFYQDEHNDTTSYTKFPKRVTNPYLESRMDVVAKRFRKEYLDAAVVPIERVNVYPQRMRGVDDVITKLKNQGNVAAVLRGRDQFEEDKYFVMRQKWAIKRYQDSTARLRQFSLKLQKETILSTISQIKMHGVEQWPYHIEFQRYIPGRPNFLKIPVSYINKHMCQDYVNGAIFEAYNINQIMVWCYNQTYPARIEIDLSRVSVFQPFRIGNFQQILPEGMFLHRAYDTQRKRPVCQFFKTPAWSNAQNRKIFEFRREQIIELREKRQKQRQQRGDDNQAPSLYDQILKQKQLQYEKFKSKQQQEKQRVQPQAAAKKKKVTKSLSEKPYPEHKLSSKDINKLKPQAVLTDKAGNPLELKETSLTARPDVKLLSHKKLKEYRLEKLRRQNPNRSIEPIPPPSNPFQQRVSNKKIKKLERIKQQKEEQAKQQSLIDELKVISQDQKKRREELLRKRQQFLKQNNSNDKEKGIEFIKASIEEDQFTGFQNQQKLLKLMQQNQKKYATEKNEENKDN